MCDPNIKECRLSRSADRIPTDAVAEAREPAAKSGPRRASPGSLCVEDQALMRAIQGGDHDAFEQLVRKYEGLVFSLARRYLGSRYDGLEDVAQQVFLRVYRSAHTYTPRAKVKTWLFSVTVNACLNEIRRLRAQKNARSNSFTAVFGESEDGPRIEDRREMSTAAALDVQALERRVEQAVDGLPEQQRLALILVRFHDCSYEEIAETMETTVPAVKSLLTRARTNLRKALAEPVAASPLGARSESAASGREMPE